ncbi:hypothetical protein [Winogradskyella luteola]|uniref:Uncharacterized protein n=1 Tax=Winogradskyella luteola TaxID=2828330 RepID=A0A9X1F6N4_9FLAO|nr:hypothetical protein [Winogradskyella luteola]MBV7268362.1 hypothetical protein [Winogradskyella luteola]
MKKLMTFTMLLFLYAAQGQGVRTLEVQKVEENTTTDLNTRLMVWDSLANGRVKYTKIGDLPITGGNDGYIFGVSLSGTNLLFNSVGDDAFSGVVDLSSIVQDNIYTSSGSISSNIVRSLTVSQDAIFAIYSDSEAMTIQDGNLGSLMTADFDNFDFTNQSGSFKAYGTNPLEIEGRRGLNIKLYDSGGNIIVPEEGQGFKTNVSGDISYVDLPDTQINNLKVIDSVYTLSETNIISSKLHLIEAFRVDGTTKVDTVVVTYPAISTHDGSTLVTTFSPKTGSALKVVPAVGVTDYRSGLQKAYILKTGHYGYASISSDAQNVIHPSSDDWIIQDYTAPIPPFDSGLIVNGTFDDSSDLTFNSPPWTVSGGVASFDDSAVDSIEFAITDNLANGTDYKLTLDLVSSETQGRFSVEVFGASAGWAQVVSFATYTEGSLSIPINFNQGEIITGFRLNASTSSDAFTIDNVSLTKD